MDTISSNFSGISTPAVSTDDLIEKEGQGLEKIEETIQEKYTTLTFVPSMK